VKGKFVFYSLCCLLGLFLCCARHSTYSIVANSYIRSDFVVNSVTNGHEMYFVAHSTAALIDWSIGKRLDLLQSKHLAAVDYSNQFVVISVGSQLTKVKKITGSVVVLTVAQQKQKGVGVAVVEGNPNLFFKFN
jgi:hypothetical protein